MVATKIFSAVTGIFIALILIILVRRSKLNSLYFIWWSLIIAAILVFAFFPNLIDIIGNFLHVSYPPVLISIFGLGMIFIKVLLMDIYITENEMRFKKLAQRMAALELLIDDPGIEQKR